MTRKEAMNEFQKVFINNKYRHDHHTLFNDFLDYALWALHPTKDKEAYEEFKHLDIRYHKDDETLPKLFELWTWAADNDGEGFYDPFGDLFMELVSHGQNGQFFTPESIADMMALMICESLKPGQIVMDCCCGSGRMLLAAAKVERKGLFFGADISATCCKMTVLNMLVNTMVGEVAHMDTLTLDHYRSWHIHVKLLPNGMKIPSYFTTGPGQSRIIPKIEKIHEEHKHNTDIERTYIENNEAIFNMPEQLSLF